MSSNKSYWGKKFDRVYGNLYKLYSSAALHCYSGELEVRLFFTATEMYNFTIVTVGTGGEYG